MSKKIVSLSGHEASVTEHLDFIIRRFEKGDQVLATTLLRELKIVLEKESV